MREMMPEGRLKKIFKILNRSVGIIALTLIITAAGIAVYALTDINRIVVNGSPEEYALYSPKEDKASFEELKAINPEIIGWINIYGTKIDYPVTQAEDNIKYLTTSPDLKYSLLGSIFLDYKNSPDFSDFCSILYGHNMTPRAMFGNVKDFEGKEYFDEHKYGDLYYNDVHHGLEIFAVFKEDGYSGFLKIRNFADSQQRQEYINEVYEKSLFTRDIGVTTDDRLVLMYTCSNAVTNGRDILVARITDHTFENPFGDVTMRTPFFGIFGKVPRWLWVYIILAVLLFILFLVKKREKRNQAKAVIIRALEEHAKKRD